MERNFCMPAQFELLSGSRGEQAFAFRRIAAAEAAQVLEQKALAELRAKNYTSAPAADVGGGELKYTLTNGAALLAEYNVLYDKYLAWIAKWEV